MSIHPTFGEIRFKLNEYFFSQLQFLKLLLLIQKITNEIVNSMFDIIF